MHDLRYDRLFDDGRAPYLWELIHLSTEPEHYFAQLLAHLDSGDGDAGDLAQIFALARRFAEDGDPQASSAELARNTMYRVFARDGFTRLDLDAGQQFVHLDGLDGFLFLARCFAERPDNEEDHWLWASLVHALEDEHGLVDVHKQLETDFSARPGVSRVLEILRKFESSVTKRPQPQTYADVQEIISKANRKDRRLIRWGKSAPAGDLKLAAADLLTASDPVKTLNYLAIFEETRFPDSSRHLIPLAHHADDKIARAAMAALIHFPSPEARTLALELLRHPPLAPDCVNLLAANHDHSDYNRLSDLLRQTRSEDEYDRLATSVRDYVKKHPHAAAADALIHVYENGPCAFCRHSIVKALLLIGKLSAELRHECRYDSEEDTRNLVRQNPTY